MNKHLLRNVAIIAHVDHGKTTLVDQLLKQSGCFGEHQKVPDRIMDRGDLERERGITILSKNTSIRWKNYKINVVDTPGHADFGGEVERIVQMVDGVLLLVDASEGPMPQTRFVLRKALEAKLKPIVVINKMDRPDARPLEVADEILDLFIELGADDEQLDFPILYASARNGYAIKHVEDTPEDFSSLFNAIVEYIPVPQGDEEGSLQLSIASLDYDNYVGRIGIGKVLRGTLSKGEEVIVCNTDGKEQHIKVANLYSFEGLVRTEKDMVAAGEIVAVSGIDSLTIGDTICHADNIEPVPFVKIDEPTISMNFMVNDSPFSGLDGTYVTSRHLRDRLYRELLSNVALQVEEISPDCFKVSGRGELHLSILIETMRREGYEFAVTRPEVILQREQGMILEPMEVLQVEVSEAYVGTVIEATGRRKGELLNMLPGLAGSVKLEIRIPSRGLIGYRSEFLTETRGTGIMHHLFDGYDAYRGEIPGRNRGSLVASEAGTAVAYGLYNAQERGNLFIEPGVEVYEGMIVGENARSQDITVNVCKKKQLTNTRASGSDDALRLVPPTIMSLEKCLEFVKNDELLEVTPHHLRLRKMILDKTTRARAQKKKEQAS
ncbi:MAG: translational GTPase TypA [Syntrophomonadaceae bacterium]|jgi:GTP-binding protein|nr:translational GTPase TypA [Bacillota bacterium]NLP23382.1 translational GTPase TypA [Syntrophomonadaceae bacterium]